jgi:hypothetical protein
MTDDEINAAIAKVAGWQPTDGDFSLVDTWEQLCGERLDPYRMYPHYLRNANAIIAILDNCYCEIHRECGYEGFPETWTIDVDTGAPNGKGRAQDESFCRAACFALLKAHGVEVTT